MQSFLPEFVGDALEIAADLPAVAEGDRRVGAASGAELAGRFAGTCARACRRAASTAPPCALAQPAVGDPFPPGRRLLWLVAVKPNVVRGTARGAISVAGTEAIARARQSR